MPNIGLPELLVILGTLLLFLLPWFFYMLTLQKALERCALEARSISPGKVWLLLIPLFDIGWHFVLVGHIATSLHNEFARRKFTDVDPAPGKKLGLAMCILFLLSIVPRVGYVTGIAGYVCWIVYWVKIAGYSGRLGPNVSSANA